MFSEFVGFLNLWFNALFNSVICVSTRGINVKLKYFNLFETSIDVA